MAFPRDRFGAHDGGPLRRGEGDETFDGRREFGRGHVIGITAESRAPPSLVHAVRRDLAEAAKGLEMLVPMPRSPNDGARATFLAQGARCDVGKWRTSARNSIRFARRSARNSSNERVEWPTVQMVRPSSPERLEDIEALTEERSCRRGQGPDTASTRSAGRSR